MTKCTTCGGVYPSTQTDGTLYFHACAPLSDAEVSSALGLPADSTKGTPAQQAQLAASPRARPNARDENLPGTAATDRGKLKAAGLGVTTVP
jgi:hypothetical protein